MDKLNARVMFALFALTATFNMKAFANTYEGNKNPIPFEFEQKLGNVDDTFTWYSNVEGLNIRMLPTLDSKIYTTLPLNTPVDVLCSITGWSMILMDDGNYYFVATKYLSDRTVNYSSEDLYLLAHLIAGEMHTMPDEDQIYTGSVVLNRVNSKYFPNTIKDVIYQKGQYSCTWDGNFEKTPTDKNWDIARFLLENGSQLPGNVLFQAEFKQGHGTYARTKYAYYCYY